MQPDSVLALQAQAVPPLPDALSWSLLLDSQLVFIAVLLLALVPLLAFQSRRGTRYVNRQERFLDHQEQANDRFIAQYDAAQRATDERHRAEREQSEAFQRLVEAQYGRVNSDSAAALEAQAEILAELKAMRAALERLSARGPAAT